MLLLYTDGMGISHTTMDTSWKHITLDHCNPEVVKIIEAALARKSTVSQLFDSKVCKGRPFAYAVSEYRNEELVGVLATSNTPEGQARRQIVLEQIIQCAQRPESCSLDIRADGP